MRRDGLILLLSQWTSAWGNHLHQLALPILVFQKTDSVADFALALLAETIPWVLCAPILSPYLQRWSAKHILLASDFFRAIICLIIAFYAWTQTELFALMFLMGTCSSIYGAFRIQTARKLIKKESTAKFLSISNGGNEAISMLAPIIGASLISIGVASNLFMLFDGLTFVLSFMLLLLLPRVEPPLRQDSERLIKNPFKLMSRVQLSSSVKAITLSEGLRSAAEGLFIPGLLTLLVQVHSFSESDYAWVRSCMAVAGVMSSYVFIKLEERWSPFRSHSASTGLIIAGVLMSPFVPGFYAALIAGFIIGFGMSFKQILADKIVIMQSVERFQAETITLINSVIALSYCLGYLASAYWDSPKYVTTLFYISSAIMVASLAVGPYLKIVGPVKSGEGIKQNEISTSRALP